MDNVERGWRRMYVRILVWLVAVLAENLLQLQRILNQKNYKKIKQQQQPPPINFWNRVNFAEKNLFSSNISCIGNKYKYKNKQQSNKNHRRYSQVISRLIKWKWKKRIESNRQGNTIHQLSNVSGYGLCWTWSDEWIECSVARWYAKAYFPLLF